MHFLLVRLLTSLLLCLHVFDGDKNNLRWIMAFHCIRDEPAESSFPVNASFPKLFDLSQSSADKKTGVKFSLRVFTVREMYMATMRGLLSETGVCI